MATRLRAVEQPVEEFTDYDSVMDMYSCRPMGASVARLVILVSGARSRSWN